MESGSIAKWNLKEGDKFEPGTSLCDVETDKATVSFDATEEGYIAKILIASGDIKVGQPLLVTVEEAGDVAAFANFALGASTASAPAVAAPVVASTPAPAAAAVAASTPAAASHAPSSSSSSSSSGRIFASPLAKKIVKEAGENLANLAIKQGSGPNGRIVAADVRTALTQPRSTPATVAAPAAPVSSVAATTTKTQVAKPAANTAAPVNGVYEEFVTTEAHQHFAARLAHSKQTVPHYYLSVELNLTNLLALRAQLNQNLLAANGNKKDNSNVLQISTLDLLIKASAHAMKSVPDVNAAWHETFVRQYHQVDINVVLSGDNNTRFVAPIVRDVSSQGISNIAKLLSDYETRLSSASTATFSDEEVKEGTFTVHDLGMYGVKSAAPILLPPQAAAVAFGTITDTVIPNLNSSKNSSNSSSNSEEQEWTVAPVMVCTMVCDHRVVDGAVSAQWLSALKNVVENPVNLLM